MSPEILVEDGYLRELPSDDFSSGSERGVDFQAEAEFKQRLLQSAFDYSYSRVRLEEEYRGFCDRNSWWLDEFALYVAIGMEQGTPWYEWPEQLRKRVGSALEESRSRLKHSVDMTMFSQFVFERQWSALMKYAHSRGIQILGDVPYYVLRDSADIWAHAEYFKVDAEGRPLFVGGVPPDYFSRTGQRWGNPVYDWFRLEETGYRWWMGRVKRGLELADMVRLDHFRGYVSYWEIPAGEATAMNGSWVELPKSFFESLKSTFPGLPLVAEDLGVITKEVNEARDSLGIPGMRVLQFAFDGSPDNTHLPPYHSKNSLVYTGTHDTNTTRGWFESEATSKERDSIQTHIGRPVTAESVADDFISMAQESSAVCAIIPMQDVLGLGGEARLNNPGMSTGNWTWRALREEIAEGSFRRLGEVTAANGRG